MLIFIFVLVHLLLILYWFLLLINYRHWYEGTPKYLGESVTAIGIGIWNLLSSLCEEV